MVDHILAGQAVSDGVLLLYGGKYAVSVQGKGGIESYTGKVPFYKSPLLKIPFFRGVVALFAQMSVGLRAMLFSISVGENEDDSLGTVSLILALTFSLGLALLLFKIIPLALAYFLVSRSDILLFNLVDGIARITVFVLYIVLIARMNDVKRLFCYHGAEHKVINAFEKNKKVTLKSAGASSRLHARCSTSFVVLVLFIAIILFSVVPLNLPLWQVLLLRLLMIVPIISVSYEFIRLATLNERFFIFGLFLKPGYWVQRLTTREPGKQELLVAMHALKQVTHN